MSTMRAAAQIQAPPESVAAYIEEMAAELATLAERVGERNLAASLRLVAVQAARMAPREDR
jgi:hypothetical protein